MNLRVEPPEKEKKSSPSSSSYPSFSSLPDDILVNCLARIPRSYYPTLSVVSKSFRSILSSTELYAARAHLGSTEQCLYVCLWDYRNTEFPQWFTLWINPNRTLPDSMIKKTKTKKKNNKKEKTIGQLLVPIKFSCVTKSPLVVGSEIYFFGNTIIERGPWSSAVRVLNCCNHTWRDAPSMNVARNNALTCFHDGKIYVIGGRPGVKPFAEAFDIKAQTWEALPDPGPGTELGDTFPYGFEDRYEEFEDRFLSSYGIRERKWDSCEINFRTSENCVMMENVWYRYGNYGGVYGCWWYDVKDGDWKEVKGLRSLGDKFKKNGGSWYPQTKLVSCGGKLLTIWLGCSNRKSGRKIWGAEIVVEMRDGNEVWGKAEWVDVVYTNPGFWMTLWHCLPVSV